VHRRVEEPLVETLHHSTDYHSGGTQTCCHRRYQHVENRADHHGTEEEPFGTKVFSELSSADLRDNVPPKERRQYRVGVGPVGISLQGNETFLVVDLLGLTGMLGSGGVSAVMAIIPTERMMRWP
jgi:hypothetical protein